MTAQDVGGMNVDSLYTELLSEISKMPVIDTHEHLPIAEGERDRNTDVLKEYLTHYMSSDLKSAGLSEAAFARVIDPTGPLLERWKLVEPYWEASRHTGYGRALDISVRGIYGIDGVNRQTLPALNEAFLRSLAPGHFHRVLKDLCGIRTSLLDAWSEGFECDRAFFRRVWQPQRYVFAEESAAKCLSAVERLSGVRIRSLDDWMEALSCEASDACAAGVVAMKMWIAYFRPLRFEDVKYATANAEFGAMLRSWEKGGRRGDAVFQFPPASQDFMMHQVLRLAAEKHLTIQFHTGTFEGNGNTLANGDPVLMTNLFLRHPNVRFDVFHMGYPYYASVSALCKMFPNVFIDMCWAHIISPAASRQALSDFLDAVPYTKISAFGGDYGFVDGVYGHLALARENVSRVLASKVRERAFDSERALRIARALFYENPVRIFGLNDL